MAKKNAKMSFESIFFDALRQGSNVNHSCPYYVRLASTSILSICLYKLPVCFCFKDAIIVRNMVFKEEFLKYFQLPSGEYKFRLLASTNNEWKTIVSVFIKRTEDLMLS